MVPSRSCSECTEEYKSCGKMVPILVLYVQKSNSLVVRWYLLVLYVHGVLGVGQAVVVHQAEEGEEGPSSGLTKHDTVRL